MNAKLKKNIFLDPDSKVLKNSSKITINFQDSVDKMLISFV